MEREKEIRREQLRSVCERERERERGGGEREREGGGSGPLEWR